MRSIPFLWRCVLVGLLTLGLAGFAYKNLKIEQDIVASLDKSRPEEAALFHKIQGSGFFQDQLYLRFLNNDPKVREALTVALAEANYALKDSSTPSLSDPAELYSFLAFLPDETFQKLVSAEHRKDVVQEIKSWINAPGGLSLIKLINQDPLLLSRELPKLIGLEGPSDPPLIAKRKGDLDWEKTRKLYEFMQKEDKNFDYLGGDFFALENYDAVQHDIWLVTVLSTILSLIVFRIFCRQWSLLLFLICGTLLSAVVALLFAEASYGALYGLILAFASTFVSFNNEALVHLSGINWQKPERTTLIAVLSAIGTTIIGFLVLLVSSSHLTKQLGLLSLGSLLGFLGFLWIFRDKLETMEFRSLDLPSWIWRKKTLVGSFTLLITLFLALPKPALKTNLEEFRFATPYLIGATEKFAAGYKALSFEALHAVPKEDFENLEKSGFVDETIFHPLRYFANEETQKRRLEERLPQLAEYQRALSAEMESEGLRSSFAPSQSLTLDRSEYLSFWQKLMPLPWESPDHYLVFLKADSDFPSAIPMHPRAFYEYILNDLSKNLALLFAFGLGAMLFYLIPWQRSLSKILLIFLPLLLALIVLQLLFYFTDRNLTILHIMGLSLVISVALDYGSVLVSTDHNPKEQGKVFLTGALTLCSFGSLLFARHPVLHELALVVFIGTLVSWLMALFTRNELQRSA